VSAVATMLGLLLVVTMLANYLATQLPAEMQVNDANHALLVENQVSRLASLLAAAANAGAVGAVLTQPVSLGSLGDPPFAAADGASIGPGVQGSGLSTSFTVTGAASYAPPTVGAAGGTTKGATCSSSTSTTLTCTDSSSAKVVWNFTSGTPTGFSVTTSGGPYYINTSASNSTIAVTASASLTLYLLVVGSNDTVTLTLTASTNTIHIVLIGNHDTVSFAAGSITSSTVLVYGVGSNDTLQTSSLTATSSKVVATFFGSYDGVSLGTTTATNSYFNAYLNGFVPSTPSSSCPVGNLAYTTDSVSVGTHSGGTYNVTYNDTTVTTGSAPSPWAATFGTPSISCPFYAVVSIPQRSSGSVGASFVVELKNTYTPDQFVSFDQGAVVYAQPSGEPLMLVDPSVNYAGGALSLWVPEFLGSVGTQVGTGIAELSVHLVSILNVSLPLSGFSLSGTTSIVVRSPYAAAWYSYLNGPASPVAGNVVCIPKTSSVCVGPFEPTGALGTVYLNLTATALAVEFATYSVSLS
jgi:hypothetical protein